MAGMAVLATHRAWVRFYEPKGDLTRRALGRAEAHGDAKALLRAQWARTVREYRREVMWTILCFERRVEVIAKLERALRVGRYTDRCGRRRTYRRTTIRAYSKTLEAWRSWPEKDLERLQKLADAPPPPLKLWYELAWHAEAERLATDVRAALLLVSLKSESLANGAPLAGAVEASNLAEDIADLLETIEEKVERLLERSVPDAEDSDAWLRRQLEGLATNGGTP